MKNKPKTKTKQKENNNNKTPYILLTLPGRRSTRTISGKIILSSIRFSLYGNGDKRGPVALTSRGTIKCTEKI